MQEGPRASDHAGLDTNLHQQVCKFRRHDVHERYAGECWRNDAQVQLF